jgi:hypothetical protein
MSSHEESVIIRRSIGDVFAYMGDITREREWQSNLVEASQDPPGPTEVGTQRRYVSEFFGKRLVNTYVVKIYEPEQRLVCETTPDSVLEATTDIRWEEVDGGTRVTMIFEGSPSGPLKFVPKRMLDATFAREVSASLAQLKERLESDR